jgi:cell cycle checkpoint protein
MVDASSQSSQDSGDDSKIPLLTASVHDVRYLASLLRALSFSNRATVSAYEGGLIVSVEESRTLLATAYVQNTIFDEFTYSPESTKNYPPTQQTQQTQGSSSSQKQQSENAYAQFEIPLNTFLECLNIFGTAGPLPSTSNNPQHKKWKKFGAESDQENIDDRGNNDDQNRGSRGRLDQFFLGGENRGTGMRMSYPAPGYPLTLLM